MAPARVDLAGTVIGAPERRATPGGTPVLRCKVECGDGRERLMLDLVVLGERAQQLSGLRAGHRIVAQGNLRALGQPGASFGSRQQIEVIAARVVAEAGDGAGK